MVIILLRVHLCVQLGCCGINGPADYHNSAWFNHTPESDGAFVPLSCCGATSQSYYCQFEAVAVIQAEQSTRNIVHSQVNAYWLAEQEISGDNIVPLEKPFYRYLAVFCDEIVRTSMQPSPAAWNGVTNSCRRYPP